MLLYVIDYHRAIVLGMGGGGGGGGQTGFYDVTIGERLRRVCCYNNETDSQVKRTAKEPLNMSRSKFLIQVLFSGLLNWILRSGITLLNEVTRG
jgi:hypothetical protein